MKSTSTFILLFIINAAFAQVGINTENPQGIFNIDGAKDNPKTGNPNATQQLNDVVVLPSGNIGIGTTTPTRKLEIISGGTSTTPIDGFKLVDGNQEKGKALISAADGSAHWGFVSLKSYNGTIGTGFNLFLNDPIYQFDTSNYNVGFYPTTSRITLGPGKWQVSLTLLITYDNDYGATSIQRDHWFWTRATFTENTGGSGPVPPTSDLVGNKFLSNIFNGPAPLGAYPKYAMINGTLVLNNTSSSSKTYYLTIGGITTSHPNLPGKLRNIGGSAGENTITAIAVQ